MPQASSPCIGVCTIDESDALCLGCGRTLDEIAGWGALPEPRRLALMAALPARLGGERRPALDAGAGAPHLGAGGGGSERWTGAS